MIKFVFMTRRVDGTSFEAFVEHHRDHHAPLFTSIPEAARYVRKYTVSHPVPADGYPKPAYDGPTKIWFASWADHDAFFASTDYRKLVHPEEARFIDLASVEVLVTQGDDSGLRPGSIARAGNRRCRRSPNVRLAAPSGSGVHSSPRVRLPARHVSRPPSRLTASRPCARRRQTALCARCPT